MQPARTYDELLEAGAAFFESLPPVIHSLKDITDRLDASNLPLALVPAALTALKTDKDSFCYNIDEQGFETLPVSIAADEDPEDSTLICILIGRNPEQIAVAETLVDLFLAEKFGAHTTLNQLTGETRPITKPTRH